MLIFLLFTVSNCISCCFYLKTDSLCPADDTKIHISNFDHNNWENLLTAISKEETVIFNIADTLEEESTYLDSIKLVKDCKFSINGLSDETSLKFDTLFSFFSDIHIALTNITIETEKYVLSAKEITMKNTKFNSIAGIKMSVEDISSDLISLKSISNLQASNFKIIYDSNANINKTTVSLQLDSSQVNIDIINVTGNVSFGAQFQGLKISLENDNKIQLNVFKCHVDLNFYMITPHSTLKIWQYFVSQAMLKSFIHFNLVEPTNIIASRFPVHSILNHGISPQHVQFYVHSTNDINYMSEYMSNLVHFDLKNSNANFILAYLS